MQMQKREMQPFLGRAVGKIKNGCAYGVQKFVCGADSFSSGGAGPSPDFGQKIPFMEPPSPESGGRTFSVSAEKVRMTCPLTGEFHLFFSIPALVRRVGTAERGSSGQGCLGYLPRISARTAA